MAPIGVFDDQHMDPFSNEINHTLTTPFTTTPSLTTAPSFTTVPPFNVSTTQDHLELRKHVQIIVTVIILCVIGVLGTFGNLLVIIVVALDRQVRNTSNILILSLAVADLIYVLFVIVFCVPEYIFYDWSVGDVGCKILVYLNNTYKCVIVFTLALIAVDRYLAVVHALRSIAWRTQRNAWIAIATAWTVALCGNTLSLIYIVEIHTHDGRNSSRCVVKVDNEDSIKISTDRYISYFSFTSFVISLGSSAVLYGLLVRKLLCNRVPGEGSESAKSLRVKKRVTVMVIAVTTTFAVCCTPKYILFWLEYSTIDPKNEFIHTVVITSQSLLVLNSCIHPILFSFMSKTFCHSVWKYLCCYLTSRIRAR